MPTVIPGLLWGDYRGGYFYAAVARLVFVHHSTFFVNSLAHYTGAATYTDGHTARNSIFTALVTLGEGYHNFHHEFPSDYRNGVEWWCVEGRARAMRAQGQLFLCAPRCVLASPSLPPRPPPAPPLSSPRQYDPTKHFIWALSLLGLTYDLNEFPSNEIVKGALQMEQKALDKAKQTVSWGPDPSTLRVLARSEFDAACSAGAQWVLLDGFVLDVGKWAGDHPGGAKLMSSRVGKDITEEFKGGYYKHSNAGHNVAHTLRIARVEGYWAK